MGYPSIYKSFTTEEEAKKYLEGIRDKDVPLIEEKVKKHIETSKKRKATTKAIHFRVPNDIYNRFMDKVEEMELDKNKVLLEMVKEWID